MTVKLSELRERDPDRFGWRLWTVTEDGRLSSPIAGGAGAAVEPIYRADCRHDNEVPSKACECGVHYVPGTENFFTTVEYLNNPATQWQGPLWCQAYTFGAAIGETACDASDEEFWMEHPRRSGAYRILGIVVPELSRESRFAVQHAALVGSVQQVRLAARYDMPAEYPYRAQLGAHYAVPVVTGQYAIGYYGNLVHAGREIERVLDQREVPALV